MHSSTTVKHYTGLSSGDITRIIYVTAEKSEGNIHDVGTSMLVQKGIKAANKMVKQALQENRIEMITYIRDEIKAKLKK